MRIYTAGWIGEDPDLGYYGTELMLDNDLEFYGTPTIADIAYEWAPTHAEWNRLQHALHGNGKGGKGKVKRI